MKRSTDRILPTHTGSLPRPGDLLDLLREKEGGEKGFNDEAFAARVRSSVADVLRQQAEAGVDVLSDGEQSKLSFFHYIRDRLGGMEGQADRPLSMYEDFPGYQAWAAQRRGNTGAMAFSRPACVGPLAWKDKQALMADIENFKQALGEVAAEEGFLPSASVGIVAQRMENQYYPTYEAYIEAIAEVMKDEYRAITDAGLVLQIDAPEMCIDRNLPEFRERPLSDFRARLELRVEALNHALTGIPDEQVRFHVCWGNGEGPHTGDVPLKDIVDVVLKVHAAAYSVEASNPRHAHEWTVWQDVKLPEGKVLIPGVIDSVTNFVEHPELVAQRIVRYAELVGRESVIAGTDCGFGTGAFAVNVYPPIVWAKLAALSEGAGIASRQLWRS